MSGDDSETKTKAATKTAASKTPAKGGGGSRATGARTSAGRGTSGSKSRTTAGKSGSPARKTPAKSGGARGNSASGKAKSRKTAASARKDDPLTRRQLPLAARVVVLVVAFAAMVGFAVVLSKLTLGPSAASESLTHSNLSPGDSIRDYLSQPQMRDTVKQLGGNIVLGMPFGVLLPALVPAARGLLRVMLATAAVMMLVELVQGALVTGRAFDIDDVILNASGAVLGYLLIGRRLGLAVHRRRRHWWHRLPVSSSRPR